MSVSDSTTLSTAGSPANWDAEQVAQWAVQISLPVIAREALEENEIDGSLLLTLSKGDLKHELSIKSFSIRRFLWGVIEQLKSQHEVLDFLYSIEIHGEEIEHLTIRDTSPEIHNLDQEILNTLRGDVEDQRRVIEDNEFARRTQGFDQLDLQAYEDEQVTLDTGEDLEQLRVQEHRDHEYARTLQLTLDNGKNYEKLRRQEERDHKYAMLFNNDGTAMAHMHRPMDNAGAEAGMKSLMALSIDSCVKNKINVADALQKGVVSLPQRKLYEEEEDMFANNKESVNRHVKTLEGKAKSVSEYVDTNDGILIGVKLPPISCLACGDNNVPGYELPCTHAHCIDCMTRLLRSALNDTSLLPLQCCRLPIDINIARSLLPAELCQTLFSRQEEIEASNKMYCPQCASFINLDLIDSTESAIFSCNCGVTLCISCRSLQHQGISCEENRSSADNSFLSLAKEKKWQQCPGCSIIVDLISGCNHITCNNCRTEFCYQCASLWSTENGNRCSSGKCEVWEEENLVARAEERVRAEEQAQGYAFRQGAARLRAQAIAMRAISANDTCTHDWFRDNDNTVTECESCGYGIYSYGMICRNECQSTVCHTCAYHRIGDYGWR